ncbi:tyrosine-type recombinase/integrase, partial [Helicobacter pylori]
ARSQRELFVGIRDFIVFKFKRMVVFNGVRDFTKMRFLSIELEKCENVKLSSIENFKQYGTGLHLFRHSFATLVYAESRDIVLTSRALGHQSLSSTKIYIHTAQEYNKQVASIFDNLLSE